MSRQAFLGFLMRIKYATPKELNKMTTEELGKLYSELVNKDISNYKHRY